MYMIIRLYKSYIHIIIFVHKTICFFMYININYLKIYINPHGEAELRNIMCEIEIYIVQKIVRLLISETSKFGTGFFLSRHCISLQRIVLKYYFS